MKWKKDSSKKVKKMNNNTKHKMFPANNNLKILEEEV